MWIQTQQGARKEISVKSRTPPYGKKLSGLIISGKRPTSPVWLYIGNHAWDEALFRESEHPLTTLALPAWYCPTMYAWPVKGCSVLIVDTGFAEADYIHDTVGSLFRDGAAVVHVSGRDTSFNTYKRICKNVR